MPDSNLVDLVRRSRTDDARRTFHRRVDEQAKTLKAAIEDGRFANERFSVGLELEAYVVDADGRLAGVPESVFDTPGCNKELGLHNVEINTAPNAFDADGIAAQAASLDEQVAAAREALRDVDLELVLDAMWTIPPEQGTAAYLSTVERVEDVTVAANMRQSPRYCAIDNDLLARTGGEIELDLPGVRRTFPSILVESLTTSIQPHLQVPDTEAFADYYTVGIRTLGPVLALATNSPFLPVDLYEVRETAGESSADGDGPDSPYDLVDSAYHEHRISVFEQSINVGDAPRKVRFPEDIDHATDVVDWLVDDHTCAPFLKEWVKDADAEDEYADRIWELDHKRGTYWRWLRAVVGGEPVAGTSERSLRIEYRPIPTQPSVADIVGIQVLVSGLIHGLVDADHPIRTLEWEATRECFYDVVETGLDATFAWVDADGDRTDDPTVVYEEVFEYARRGLREQGLAPDAIDDYLGPIEARWTERTTPSRWKKQRVRDRLDDGDDLRSAIEGMQREYIERSRTGEPFVEW